VITSPAGGSSFPTPNPYPVTFRVTASDNVGVTRVEYLTVADGAAPARALGASSSPPGFPLDLSGADVGRLLGCSSFAGLVVARATDACANSSPSEPVAISLTPTCASTGPAAASEGGLEWTSQLDVAHAKGQVVLNGRAATFTAPGRSLWVGKALRGENHVEAVLVSAAGTPGTWRFELKGVEPGSLRVVAGEVSAVASDAIVFRLRGRAGERVVFAFRKR
jgi:hypothetical protein